MSSLINCTMTCWEAGGTGSHPTAVSMSLCPWARHFTPNCLHLGQLILYSCDYIYMPLLLILTANFALRCVCCWAYLLLLGPEHGALGPNGVLARSARNLLLLEEFLLFFCWCFLFLRALGCFKSCIILHGFQNRWKLQYSAVNEFKLSNMLSSATYGHFHFWKDVQSRTVTPNDLKCCTLIRVDLLYI